MKVLWFSHVPAFPDEIGNSEYKGGTWISALLKHVSQLDAIELAVCSHSQGSTVSRLVIDRTIYYNIQPNTNVIDKIYSKLFHKLSNEDIELYLEIIEEFQPDIIQVFGTEGGFGRIAEHTDVPIIIHLQGLINPIVDAWFPRGVNLFDTFFASSIRSLILGNGYFHQYFYIQKQAKREMDIISMNRYFFSKTDWDKAYIKLLNHSATFFHCNEMMRDEFYVKKWNWPSKTKKYVFVSVLNGEIYKGLDNVLNIAAILRYEKELSIEWNIIGAIPRPSEIKLFEKKAKVRFNDLHVVFKGKMDVDELIEEFQRAHLFIHPSHIDNSPNSVCEAMLLGMPVLCGDVGGCSSLINDGINGYLLPDNEPYTWSTMISELLRDQEISVKVGKTARLDAWERHNPDSIIDSILNAYKCLSEN